MIRTFKHAGLEKFFFSGSRAGIQPAHDKRLRLRLETLEAAKVLKDMDVPGWNFHALQDDLEGSWSIKVNGNWRITFQFEEEDVVLIDYQDHF